MWQKVFPLKKKGWFYVHSVRCSSGKSEVKADHKHLGDHANPVSCVQMVENCQITSLSSLFTGLSGGGDRKNREGEVWMLVLEVVSQLMRHKELQLQEKKKNKKTTTTNSNSIQSTIVGEVRRPVLLTNLSVSTHDYQWRIMLQNKWTAQQKWTRWKRWVSGGTITPSRCYMQNRHNAPWRPSRRPPHLFHSETAPVCATPQDTQCRIECLKNNNDAEGNWTTPHAVLLKAFSPKDYSEKWMKNSFCSNLGNISLKFRMENSLSFMNWKSSLQKKHWLLLGKKRFKLFEKAQHWSWTSSCRFDKS